MWCCFLVILSNGTVSEKFRLMLLMLFHLKSIKDVARELILIYTIQVEKIVCAVKKDNICTIKKKKRRKKNETFDFGFFANMAINHKHMHFVARMIFLITKKLSVHWNNNCRVFENKRYIYVCFREGLFSPSTLFWYIFFFIRICTDAKKKFKIWKKKNSCT